MNRYERYLEEKKTAELEALTHASVGAIRKILGLSNSAWNDWLDRIACDWMKYNRTIDLVRLDIKTGRINADKHGNKIPYDGWNTINNFADWKLPLSSEEFKYFKENYPRNWQLNHSKWVTRLWGRSALKQALPTCPHCAMFVEQAIQIKEGS